MADKRARRRETKYGKRLKRRKSLAGKIGGGGFYLIPTGANAGKRVPKALSILIGLAREKGISVG